MNHRIQEQPEGNVVGIELSLRWRQIPSIVLLMCLAIVMPASSQVLPRGDKASYVSFQKVTGGFTLSAAGKSAPLCISSHDYPGVIRAVLDLQSDIGRVTNGESELLMDDLPSSKEIVLVGTLGRNPEIDRLVLEKKLDVSGIEGKWEAYVIQIVEKPLPDVDQALVVVGSDKRGTIFGAYDLSSRIGVSPWNWWADVPVKRHSGLYVKPGPHTDGSPAVKYRGIFINDEAPALSSWAYAKFGGFNHAFYEKVFELILRMKGNYLWPAMWGRAFYDDDTLNARLADEYGVVIGTSHHEPLMRAHDEWRRYGKGPWNYEKNDSVLKVFWKQGVQRMGPNESLVTIGMRGDGDEPMTEGANIALLERIVRDQRQILGETTHKDPSTIPQVWALYKEVQEYYDKGMRVPDDVTLLLCDDNWGNIRKLPKLGDPPRSGGYGIYYHFDYVGAPRNYKWLNTNQISRVWEQMHLAHSYGADRLWIVNVGDIKPMEFPIEFFLDYAWNPDKWPAEKLPEYARLWAERQFGEKHSRAIAEILTMYTQFNSRRKPELLSPETYSLVNYREAETIVSEYNKLAAQAQAIGNTLPPEYLAAYYQLVLHPVTACANLNDLYVTVGQNRLFAKQRRAGTNGLAERARALYARDSVISHYYNNVLAGGKWKYMMAQTHIGYTYWQQPDKNAMPAVVTLELPTAAEMGVAVEGSDRWWPNETSEAVLPESDRFSRQSYYIEVFNQGKTPFEYSVKAGQEWVHISPQSGKVGLEKRLRVSVDWKNVPAGRHRVPILISGPNKSTVAVQAVVHNPPVPKQNAIVGFIESDGYVSIEAEHFSQAIEVPPVKWLRIPDLGRTRSAMTVLPATSPAQTPGGASPRLEYQMNLFDKGDVNVRVYLSPTLNFQNSQGLRYAISFDDDPPKTLIMNSGNSLQAWEQWVSDNINISVSQHTLRDAGQHILKFWMVDPGVVLQKIVVETREIRPSYLGPPESFRAPAIARHKQ